MDRAEWMERNRWIGIEWMGRNGWIGMGGWERMDDREE